VNLTIDCNAEKVAKYVMDIAERQLPFAQMRTLTQLAYRTKKAVYDEMDLVLDPPLKKYTLTSMRVDPATSKVGMVSKVYLNDFRGEDRSLGHLFRGGDRRWKNMEGALLRKGLMLPGMYAVPGVGAPLDQYGNIPASFVRSILSYFQALNEGNMKQKTKKLKSKTRVDKDTGFKTIYGNEYFISFGPGRASARTGLKSGYTYQQNQHLKPGIYSRSGTHGVKITPIIMFVHKKKPYRRYIDLHTLGERVLNQNKNAYFAQNFADAIGGTRGIQRMVEAAD